MHNTVLVFDILLSKYAYVYSYIQYMEYIHRPRLHGTGRIWDRSAEIRPFSPVYTRIRPVRGSQIRPVLVCLHGRKGRISARFQIRPVPCKRGLN
jgi:hypothetical protein